MPKLVCPCGFVHNLSPIPDHGWVTILDENYEQLIDASILAYEICGHAIPSDDHPRVKEWDQAHRFIAENSSRIYECPKCGRLIWMKRTPQGQTYQVFAPENIT